MSHVSDIRKILELFESKQQLNEAVDYAGMFNDVKKLNTLVVHTLEKHDLGVFPPFIPDSDMNTYVSSIVDMVRTSMKKNDRIVWFLRDVKLSYLQDIMVSLHNKANQTKDDQEKFQVYESLYTVALKTQTKALSVVAAKAGVGPQIIDSGLMGYTNVSQIKTKLEEFEHYLSYQIPAIQNVVFLYQSYRELTITFQKAEEEWKKRANELIPYDPDDGEIIMKFPDGFMWVNLDREFCRIEGDAMGHCGNSASHKYGDRVFSLRKLVEENGQTFVRPSLTFIVDGYDMIGEMKGRNNQKPDKKYHPYIVALLKSRVITGIKGGGYMPQNNFSINDLPEETRTELLSLKPELATLQDFADMYGTSSPKFIRRLDSAVDTAGNNFNYEKIDGDTVIISKYEDFERFTRHDYDDEILEWLFSVISDGTDEEELQQDITFDDVTDLIDGLNTEEYEKLMGELNLDAVPHNDTQRYRRNLRQAAEEFRLNPDMMETFNKLINTQTKSVQKIARDWFMKYLELGIYLEGNAYADIDKTNSNFPVVIKIDMDDYITLLSAADAGDDDEYAYYYREIQEYGWQGTGGNHHERVEEDRKKAKLPTSLKGLKKVFKSTNLDTGDIHGKDYSRAFARVWFD